VVRREHPAAPAVSRAVIMIVVCGVPVGGVRIVSHF
jgi:hypothetical protein